MFSLFDADASGALSYAEATDALKSLKIGLMDEDIKGMIEQIDVDKDNAVAKVELRDALQSRSVYNFQEGRFFVAVTLSEAETLRLAIHQSILRGPDAVGGFMTNDTALALRLSDQVVLDSAGSLYAAGETRYQTKVGWPSETHLCVRWSP